MKLKSLRRRLVRDLVLLQMLAGMLVIGIYLAGSWAANEITDDIGDEAVEVVREALDRGADGRLVIRATAALSELRHIHPEFWFIAHDTTGTDELVEGNVPAKYRNLAATLDGTREVVIGEERWGQIRAMVRFKRMDSRAGIVNLLVKAGCPLSARGIGRGLVMIGTVMVAPMAAISIITMMLLMPWVIRGEFRGLFATTALVDRIDVHDRSTRLPIDGVTEEMLPLVHAVNRAFDRLNDGYVQQERFLADAAHELRTPITVLQIRLDALPEDPLKSKLLYDVARLDTLAEQLLDLQRLHRAPASLHDPVDLKALCERVGADLAPLAIQHECCLSVNAPCPASARGDAPALERVVANLLQNAIEHGGGGCEIQIRACPPSSIEVNDSGPGIPAAQREQVLAPFHRLAPRRRGAGLGLHLVTEIVKLHGGRMTIGTSALGGASIRIELNAMA